MILRKIIFMSKTYKLILLTDLDNAAQLLALDIRNEEYIRRWMFNEDIIEPSEHFAWIERLKNDPSQLYFAIMDDNACPCGAVNLKKIDLWCKTAELGFYKSQRVDEKGLMAKSLSALLDYSFDTIGLDRVYSEVFEGNVKSLNIHKKLLFTEEGFMRSHIIKGGARIGVHLFGLLKDEWLAGRFRNGAESDIIVSVPQLSSVKNL
jgi:UDP-4-amino-4,6-dideoxy-N-acetyl-beta-L-altrosamine N-acetyltransferase